MRKLLGAFVVLLAVAALAHPALAATTLTDDDLEQVTAAGEPQVLIAEAATGVATATFVDDAVFNLNIPTNSQQGLRALTVANVVGEAQLLVNLNVLSASGSINNTDQRNFSVQSWGSTMPLLSATVAGVPGISQTTTANAACTTSCTSNPLNKANGNIGVVAAPGQIQIASASADEIIRASGGTGAFVSSDSQPVFNLTFSPNGQVDLSALFIANVVGRVQAAYNINIAAAALNLVPSPDTPFASPTLFAVGTIKQVNSGVQFRGTPLGVGNTLATVNVTQTPN